MTNPLLYICHALTKHNFKTVDSRKIYDYTQGSCSLERTLGGVVEVYNYPVKEAIREKCSCGLMREREVNSETKQAEIVRTLGATHPDSN